MKRSIQRAVLKWRIARLIKRWNRTTEPYAACGNAIAFEVRPSLLPLWKKIMALDLQLEELDR